MTGQVIRLGFEVLEGRSMPSVAPECPARTPPSHEPPVLAQPAPTAPLAPAAPTLTTGHSGGRRHPSPIDWHHQHHNGGSHPARHHNHPPSRSHATNHPSERGSMEVTGSGSYICTLVFGGMPTGYHFTGQAVLPRIGPVDVLIDAYGVGFKDDGAARGEVILSNSKGSVTLVLAGPAQSRLSVLPAEFSFRIAGATGDFRSLGHSGQVRLTRIADGIPVRDGIHFPETGQFQLAIVPG